MQTLLSRLMTEWSANLLIWLEIGAACYRTEKAQIPQKCWGECREKGDSWRDCWEQCWEDGFVRKRNGTVPSCPPFPGTLPSTLPSTFGGFGLSQSCSRRLRSQDMAEQCQGTAVRYPSGTSLETNLKSQQEAARCAI